jgi:phosphoglycolate phosphatase
MSGVTFPAVVLFDLDGTLLDSAPDMLATVNRMRSARGRDAMTLEALRPHVSKGARAMIAAAFPDLGGEVPEERIREFLDIYAQELGRHSTLFEGVPALLEAIETAGSRWGIVTNKPESLARQIVVDWRWQTRCAVLVGGDTLPQRKPHPLPLLHAASVLGVSARDCAYVGDDQRDIEAARAAGMPSVVALWGYRLPEEDVTSWQGDVQAATPHVLLQSELWTSLR